MISRNNVDRRHISSFQFLAIALEKHWGGARVTSLLLTSKDLTPGLTPQLLTTNTTSTLVTHQLLSSLIHPTKPLLLILSYTCFPPETPLLTPAPPPHSHTLFLAAVTSSSSCASRSFLATGECCLLARQFEQPPSSPRVSSKPAAQSRLTISPYDK